MCQPGWPSQSAIPYPFLRIGRILFSIFWQDLFGLSVRLMLPVVSVMSVLLRALGCMIRQPECLRCCIPLIQSTIILYLFKTEDSTCHVSNQADCVVRQSILLSSYWSHTLQYLLTRICVGLSVKSMLPVTSVSSVYCARLAAWSDSWNVWDVAPL